MRSLRIVYFGTPEFASSILDYLLNTNVDIAAVVTRPDRPQGRFLKESPSAVKTLILERKKEIPIFQPEKCSDPEFLAHLKRIQADLFVVVSFGQILPPTLLAIPPKGSINVHPSLLPKYRGAAPIQRALFHGEEETGISIQKIVQQLDAGDVIATAKMEILPNMTYGELHQELCELAKPLLLLVLQSFEKGNPPAEPQNHSLATYAPKLTVEEGKIHWEKPAHEIHNLIRAFSPKPGAWCLFRAPSGEEKRIKIFRSAIVDQEGEPGTLSSDGIVACGSKSLEIIELQPEGKKPMTSADWLRGFKTLPKF